MELSEYQAAAAATAVYPRANKMGLYYTALGLAGEVGELCNKTKKILRDDEGQVSEQRWNNLRAELGDILWYLASYANEMGVELNTVAHDNILKLRDRMQRDKIRGDGDER